MPGALPEGEAVPRDGALPPGTALGERGFGVYVHVPFCASRCGYCDFNTYTAAELGGGASRDAYAGTVLAELDLARRIVTPPRVDTVFVGGGTPTLLSTDDLARILEAIDRTWGLAADAEITTEANPESVTPASLQRLRKAGFTRISLGMQSIAPGVLQVLERRHTAGRAPAAAAEAREAGFDHVNLDLIYGTPGETADDFAASLAAAVGAGVDHVSAYALIVEDGTRLAARMRRGDLPYPDDDVAADRYLAADAALGAAGLSWYEVSNWAAGPAAQCRHNLLYWTGGDWWGLGPGAHSHIGGADQGHSGGADQGHSGGADQGHSGGVRWWNVKHPSAYAARLAAGESPGYAREVLSSDDRHVEDVMLRLRLASGLPLSVLDGPGRAAAERAAAGGLLETRDGRVVLTLRGRLLADAVVRDLLL